MDPLNDLLIRVKNAYLANHKSLDIPYSKQKEKLAEILVKTKYVDSLEVTGEKINKILRIGLRYSAKKPAINNLKLFSRPGLRIYTKSKDIRKVLGGEGISIISTPKGLMVGQEAKRNGLGGEVICQIW